MKKIYLLIIGLFLVIINTIAQEFDDYYPFPYDSVFFEPNIIDEALYPSIPFNGLMPLVKSSDPEDMFLPINNGPHWLGVMDVADVEVGEFPFRNWMGKVSYENKQIQFITAYEDTIRIRTNIELNTSDTCIFHHWNQIYQLVVTYDNLLEDGNDFIKEYHFQVLDELSNPVSGNFVDFSGFDSYDVELMTFRISMDRGILSTPSFFYFPYSKQYDFKDFAYNILDQSTLNSYKVFHQNIGDEVHSHDQERSSGFTLDIETNVYYKTVCVNQEYDEDIQRLIRVSDVWVLKNTGPSFSQLKDTLYLNSFTDLNKAIPDGFGTYMNEVGSFYSDIDHSFIIIRDDRYYINNGNLGIIKFIDAESHDTYWYHLGHRFRYSSVSWFFDWSWEDDFHKPIYANINGEEWGEPYMDSFIMDVPEASQKDFRLLLREHSLRLQSDQQYESARIYSIKGTFVKYISKNELNYDIMTDDLAKGIYIFWLWDGETSHPVKFIK